MDDKVFEVLWNYQSIFVALIDNCSFQNHVINRRF